MPQSAETRSRRILEKYHTGDFHSAIDSYRGVPPVLLERVILLLGEPIVFKFTSFERERIASKVERLKTENAERNARLIAEQLASAEHAQRFEQLKEAVATQYGNDWGAAKVAAASEYLQSVLDKYLTKPARLYCRTLRVTALWGAKVKERLECTQTELDRWDKDGRLPHAFLRICSPGGKKVLGRKWFDDEVIKACNLVADWREQDAKRKVARKTKLTLVT